MAHINIHQYAKDIQCDLLCLCYELCYALVDFYRPKWTFHNLMRVVIWVITVRQFAAGLWERGEYLEFKREIQRQL